MTDRPLKSNHFWEGELPTREYDKPIFSRKIFVGGVPWDIREAALQDAFREFGACQVEWPGCEARYQGANGFQNANGKRKSGYVYIIYEDECSITQLLRECSQEVGGAGEWYFKINAQRTKSTETRQVQVIPWVTCDSTYALDKNAMALGVEPKRTVFVGALHGMITAQLDRYRIYREIIGISQVLHSIMEDKFGPVECVQLDTDKYKYPIGSGRVTFRSHVSYFRAIEVGLLEVVTSKFKVSSCMKCKNAQAMQFCREKDCFKYYCDDCWRADHYNGSGNENHGVVNVPSLKSPRKSQNQDIITPPSSRCGSPQKQGAYFAAMSQNYEPYCYGAPQVLFKVDDQQVLDDIARTDLSMAQLYISDLNGYQHNHGHGHQFQPFIIGSPMMLPYTPMPSPPSISVADPTLGYLNMAAAYFASCGGSNGGYEVPKSQSYQYHQQPSSNGNSNTRSTASRSDPTITSAASSSSTSTYRPPAMTTSTTSTRRTPGRRPPQSYSYSRRQF